MTTPLAAIVMAHQDPEQVRRLVGALEDVPVALHCDSKAPVAVAAAMVRGFGSRVVAVPRSSGALDSWSLVRIELAALRAALRQSSARHIVVLSGADYPLLGTAALLQRLQAWDGSSCLTNEPVPYARWSGGGGRWRTEHRFWTRGDDVVKIGRIPLRNPWRRAIPAGLQVRASSQWKVYGRADAERLLSVVDQHPELVRFWRSTLVPDESFVASVLSSPAFTGGSVLPRSPGVPWFTQWDDGAHHPRWLVAADYPDLQRAMAGPSAVPDALAGPAAPAPEPWFARKLSSVASGDLLDRIDTELRGSGADQPRPRQ